MNNQFKPSDRKIIDAIVTAAEHVGGVHALEMIGKRKKWRTHVSSGYLWYSNAVTHSSGIVKIK
jgi:hypothetical protein